MKRPVINIYIVMLILILSSACGPSTATPTAIPVNSGPLGLAPTSTPTSAPPIVQAPVDMKPACTPPDSNVKVTSFCANLGAKVGGATIKDSGPTGGYFISKPAGWQCDWSPDKGVCSGPSNSTAVYVSCSSCVAPNAVPPKDFQCQKGMIKKNNDCELDLNGDWITCTYESHWDNATQLCLDNVTDKLIQPTDICPPGYPYYDAYGSCYVQPILWSADDCQYTSVTLGDCTIQQKPGDGGAVNSCPAGTTWNGSCCKGSDNLCH